MSKSYRCARFIFCCGLALAPALSQPGPWSKEAEAALNTAQKVTVKPMAVSPHKGDMFDLGIQIQNGRSEPVSRTTDTEVDVQLLGPSDNVVKTDTCKIRAASAEGKCVLQAPDPGYYKIRAVPKNKDLLHSTDYLLVLPDKTGQKKNEPPPEKKSTPQSPGSKKEEPAKVPLAGLAIPSQSRRGFAPIWKAAYRVDQPQQEPATSATESCTPSRSTAKVWLSISKGTQPDGAFQAGLDSAVIQATFDADDGGCAPSDITVLLRPDHGGEIDNGPLVIPKFSRTGRNVHVQLKSPYPVLVSVDYSVSPRTYEVRAATGMQATFVRPILGIGIVPNTLQTLSLIDSGPILVQFYDATGHTAPTEFDRRVSFLSNNSVIGARDQSMVVKAGQYEAKTVLVPFWVGKASITVAADRLQPAIHPVEVTALLVTTVCLIGGLLGGLIADAGGKRWSRGAIGIVTGIVLTWAYVFGILPKVDATVAHNAASVLVVAIIGGYLGIKAIDLVLRSLNWPNTPAQP